MLIAENAKPDRYYRAVRSDILPLLSPQGKRILDVGCGEGATGKALKDAGACEVAGVEYVPAAARAAAEILDSVVAGDVCTADLPFPPGHFDIILCLDVLEHLAMPRLALARLVPLLAPDGEMIISLPNIRYIGTLKQLVWDADWPEEPSGVFDGTHLRWFTLKSTRRLLGGAGLEIVETVRHASRPFQTITDRFSALAPFLPDWFTAQFVHRVRRISRL